MNEEWLPGEWKGEPSAKELLLRLQRVTADLVRLATVELPHAERRSNSRTAGAATRAKAADDVARLQAEMTQATLRRNRLVVTLMEHYGHRFLHYCQHQFRFDYDDADDVTQEAMIKILANIGSFNPAKGRAETWMFTVVHRLAIDLLRRRSREHEISQEWLHQVAVFSEQGIAPFLTEEVSVGAATAPDLGDFVDDDISDKYVLSRIRCLVMAIEGLEEDDREVLKRGPGRSGPKNQALMAAWLRLRLGLTDCLAASEERGPDES